MRYGLLHLAFLSPFLAAAAVPGHYIVEMAGDPVAVHIAKHARAAGIRSDAAQQRRTQIRQEQRPVRTRLEAAQAEIAASVDTVANAFIVRIPDDQAAQLESIPGVTRVYPVRMFKLSLDRALPLHHVPEAWQQVGGNAGAGMRIALIDTGIDVQHPGFQDPSLSIPSGFPRANTTDDLAFTSNKVIVARSYTDLLPVPETDRSPRDRVGHGTATAMAAAGVTNTGPLAAITGVAPKAYLGSYKVFGTPGSNDGATDGAILKAIDDAVADGMDVINLSLGSLEAARLESDIIVQAVERASALGVLVVVAAGNDGPDTNTIGSPATAPSAIAVGASKNDRVFAASATVSGGNPVLAVPGSGAASRAPVTGALTPVSTLDQDGLACLPLPTGSLQGRIAFILRGQCTFEEKLNNVQRAGAIAALIYTQQSQPDPITMSVGTATLPASMISYAAGVDIVQRLARNPALTATLTFTIGEVMASTDGLVGFSSKGPSVDLSVKPDLVAVGTNFYTAAQKFDRRGALYDANGYTLTQGTSFSTPLLAGAAAVLKAARPGLTLAQYRSLLINTAGTWSGSVQQIGAGILDLSAAVRATAAAFPTAVSFEAGAASPNVSRSLTISNVGTASTVFRLSTAPTAGAPAPVLSAGTVSLDPGASTQITVTFSASSLAPGQYEGSIRVADTTSGLEMRVPYWYAVASATPSSITLLDVHTGGRPLESVTNAVKFRVTDSSGIPLTNIQPVVTVVSGDGEITSVTSRDRLVPGEFGITVRLGPRRGANVIRIQAGDVVKDVTI
jgi:minor extracellular serine protease Vpr